MEKKSQTQENRLDALEEQFKGLDRKLDVKFYELLRECRSSINEEKIARLDAEADTLQWFATMILIAALIIVIISG